MGAIIPKGEKIKTFRDLLNKMRPQFEMALPRHVDAGRLMRMAMTTFQRVPKLLDCTQESVLGALLEVATLGLEIDTGTGQAYLIPYKTKATLILGYKGLIELSYRTDRLLSIYAREVYAVDEFDFALGLEPRLEHVPDLNAEDRGDMVAVYAVAHLKGGGRLFEVMGKGDVLAIKRRSRASSEGPWVTDEAMMWRKTAIRRLAKVLPKSAELQRAVSLDEAADRGEQDLTIDLGEATVIGSDDKPAADSKGGATA